MQNGSITAELKLAAARLGFAAVGICPAVSPTGLSQLQAWLAAGYAGEMQYLEGRQEAYAHPRHVLDGARSMVMLSVDYRTVEPTSACEGEGRVARYGWGTDYHDLIHDQLKQLGTCLRQLVPGASARGVVDTAPLLEREFAQLAGLGWRGKNTLLLNKHRGSWFFLAALLTDAELEYDDAHEADHCGTCRACLDACPTGAFVQPYVLDSRRCISYLTIELRGPVPHELRPRIGDWLFGCDVCQDVCPWNSHAPRTNTAELQPRERMNPVELAELFFMDEAAFRARFRHTPLWRPKRRGLLRNAAIVLGNQRAESCQHALEHGLHDEEPIVRGACAWALGMLPADSARRALLARRAVEADAEVADEISAALEARG